MKPVKTDTAPAAIGPYSQAIESDGLLFVSGQTPIDPATGKLIDGGIAEQTARVLDNVKAILAAAGSDLGHVVKTTCFLQNMSDFAAFNEVYATYFGEVPPARSTVGVAALPLGARVEVEVVARI